MSHLRDSTLQRIEVQYFNAYVHVCAVMWECAFCELRCLTNSKDASLNPCEMYDLYDRLWDMGTLLKTDECLDIFEDAYRPWPVQRPDNLSMQRWYQKKRERHASQMEGLRNFHEFEDQDGYIGILKEVMGLFGDAIHISFQRNIGDWLERTDGSQSNSKLTACARERKEGVLSHNNHAERTFAVFRSMLGRFPSMSLRNAASLSFSRLNGTYKLGGKGMDTGIVHTAPKDLLDAVFDLCSVRTGSLGAVTKMLRAHRHADSADAADYHRRKNKEKERAAIEKAKRKANEMDKVNIFL